ncbi:GNAT family N-acetyltransferase [bacterium]|nr:GNAT family N-acetyltransferase [bacterium]
MQIQRLRKGDEERVQAIAEAFKETRLDPESASEILDRNDTILLVAIQRNEVLGFALGFVLPRIDHAGRMLFLYEITVKPGYRRRGIARNLFGEFLRIGNDSGVVKMFVVTNENNYPAMSLCRSMGGKRKSADDVIYEFYFNDTPIEISESSGLHRRLKGL